MRELEEVLSKCKEAGVHEAAVVPVEKIVFSDEVREMCAVNQCGQYGKTWACPPGVGTVEECRERAMKYKNVVVFSTVSNLEDSFDWDGMMDAKKRHEEVSKKVREIFLEDRDDILMLSSEGCQNCKSCTYPDAPCRFPDQMFPSVESFGIYVNKEASAAGIHYINGANTVTYFSNIFF